MCDVEYEPCHCECHVVGVQVRHVRPCCHLTYMKYLKMEGLRNVVDPLLFAKAYQKYRQQCHSVGVEPKPLIETGKY